MIAGGAGGPVCLILLPDLVNLGVVEVDMLGVDLVGLLVYGVRDDEEVPAAENSEFCEICDMGENLL